jgi:hypothetical protein
MFSLAVAALAPLKYFDNPLSQRPSSFTAFLFFVWYEWYGSSVGVWYERYERYWSSVAVTEKQKPPLAAKCNLGHPYLRNEFQAGDRILAGTNIRSSGY